MTADVLATVHEWRCGGCPVRPALLGEYAESGGVYIRTSGRMSHARHTIYNLHHGPVVTHCAACCQAGRYPWRELSYGRESRRIQERAYAGPVPAVACTCRV